MEIRNCRTPVARGPTGEAASPGFLKKLPQANSPVANSTSHGTSRAKKLDGVSNSSAAPTAPPARLMIARVRNFSPPAPKTMLRPTQPVVTWPGNRAMVEAMLAARASSPEKISAGRVTKEPPPARAFCTPAQSATANSRSSVSMGPV